MKLQSWQRWPANFIIDVNGFDWVGFYRVVGPDLLKIGPHQGRHGCLVIPFARGVRGARRLETKRLRLSMMSKI